MRKSFFRILSCFLGALTVLNSVSMEVNAKPLNSVEKALIGTASTGAGVVIIGGVLWLINKKAHEQDIIPCSGKEYPVFDADKMCNGEWTNRLDSTRDERLKDIVNCLVFWSQDGNDSGNKAFEAALNLYAMETCGVGGYGEVVPDGDFSADGIIVDAKSRLIANWELYCKNPNAPYWLRTHPIDAVPFENICLVLGAKYRISLHKPGVSDEEIIRRQIGAFCAVAKVLLDIIDDEAALDAELMAKYNIVKNALVPVRCKLSADGELIERLYGGSRQEAGDNEGMLYQRFEHRVKNVQRFQDGLRYNDSDDVDFTDEDD